MLSQGFLRFRILFIFFIGTLFFFAITVRALQLQLIPNRKLFQLSQSQYQTAVTLFAKRGSIYDRSMQELAISRKSGSLFANPRKIKNRKKTAERLSSLTGISFQKIFKKIKSKKSFVWIARLVDDDVIKKLTRFPIDGIGVIYEYRRFYSNQELAGQLLGAVGVDSQGIEGVEYGYDALLQGKKESIALLRDARGRVISMEETLFVESQEGNALVLTIDKSLQFLVERGLKEQVEKFNAKQGLAVVQNARTGEILALAHYPFFNPNVFQKSPQPLWRNRAVMETFEPGSTFKVFLAASALEQGILPSEKFYCENGLFRLNKKDSIREAERHQYKWLTFNEVVKFSSNIGAAKIGLKIGKKVFHEKVSEFGFGTKTGIDVPGESLGLVKELSQWGKVELSNIAFGQGIGVTAIQLVSAMSAVANGGSYMKPFLVKKIIDSKTGEIKETPPQILRQVVSPRLSKKLTQMLVQVTKKEGTGFLAALEEYSVAGKTGTAQKPNPKGRGYLADKFVASFLGFFPADSQDEKYTILVVIDEPKKVQFASVVAAPLFKTIASHTARLYPFQKQLDQKPVETSMASPQYSKLKEEQSIVMTDVERMPDLRGKSMREVLDFASQMGLIIKVKGSGVVVDQSIEAGAVLKRGQRCVITFRGPSS